jgi:probable rRNA maturation factor
VTDARGRPVSAAGLGHWLARAAPRRARGHVGVALVSDAVMRRLNRQFRRIDRPTDVLSFPAQQRTAPETRPKARGQRPKFRAGRLSLRPSASGRRPDFLGEIAIAQEVARRQARALGHSVGVEIRILALHGLLHLLGYDHDTDQGEMGRVEERLRRRCGLPSALIARAPGRLRHR